MIFTVLLWLLVTIVFIIIAIFETLIWVAVLFILKIVFFPFALIKEFMKLRQKKKKDEYQELLDKLDKE